MLCRLASVEGRRGPAAGAGRGPRDASGPGGLLPRGAAEGGGVPPSFAPCRCCPQPAVGATSSSSVWWLPSSRCRIPTRKPGPERCRPAAAASVAPPAVRGLECPLRPARRGGACLLRPGWLDHPRPAGALPCADVPSALPLSGRGPAPPWALPRAAGVCHQHCLRFAPSFARTDGHAPHRGEGQPPRVATIGPTSHNKTAPLPVWRSSAGFSSSAAHADPDAAGPEGPPCLDASRTQSGERRAPHRGLATRTGGGRRGAPPPLPSNALLGCLLRQRHVSDVRRSRDGGGMGAAGCCDHSHGSPVILSPSVLPVSLQGVCLATPGHGFRLRCVQPVSITW